MSDWITHRPPTEQDADRQGFVWADYGNGLVGQHPWQDVGDRPWMPTNRPEPYVKPKRWDVRRYPDTGYWYVIEAKSGDVRSYAVPTRNAAERIAAIYEEVSP